MPDTEQFRLRAARRDDIPRIEHLIERSVRGLSVAHYDAAQIESALRYMFGVDSQLVDDGTYHVIEAGGALAAAGGWSRRRTLFGGDQWKHGADEPLDPTREPARIRAFFVDPAWSRRGLGRALFDVCVRDVLMAGFRRLELMATLPGEPLYRALGFAADERVELALPDGVRVPLVRDVARNRRLIAGALLQALGRRISNRHRAPSERSHRSRTGAPTTFATSSSTA